MCCILSEKYHSQQNLQGVGQIVPCAAICGDIRGRRGSCCNACVGLLSQTIPGRMRETLMPLVTSTQNCRRVCARQSPESFLNVCAV